MKVLISGICGFVGSCIANALLEYDPTMELVGIDNFSRVGSSVNVEPLRARGVKLIYADVRAASDLELIPPVQWIIDAAAKPSVLAGIDGAVSSRQLVENNLYGTINLLELAKRSGAGFILISTSRVYAVKHLRQLPIVADQVAFRIDLSRTLPTGVTKNGITEEFSTEPPLSLYGSSKLASEILALEYGEAFGLPVWINRCGVLAGAGQFGRPDQGIFAYWINAYLRRRPMRYIGFDGTGFQTRDCLHPRDVIQLLTRQMNHRGEGKPRILNLGGGSKNAISLAQLSQWCAQRFGAHDIEVDHEPRPFDVPWLVLDSALAQSAWDWQPCTNISSILDEIANHAKAHRKWLETSASLKTEISA